VDVNNAEVALLLIEREKAMIPVNPKAFSMSQQSGQRLNSLYTEVSWSTGMDLLTLLIELNSKDSMEAPYRKSYKVLP
jgi:hypothetical protein